MPYRQEHNCAEDRISEKGLMERSAEEIAADVRKYLFARGLDLVQAFDVARYNDLIVGHESLVPLPQFGRRGALAVLVGNTRALWPCFIEAFHASERLRACGNPLDTWIVSVLEDCVGQIPEPCELRFSHEPGDGFVSMLHLAEASGLAHVGPAHLAVHPVHGTWIGLRAVLVVDAGAPGGHPEFAEPACQTCGAPCLEALKAAQANTEADEIASSWQAWVAVRDACPVGEAARYSEAQIRYHYTKDPSALYLQPLSGVIKT